MRFDCEPSSTANYRGSIISDDLIHSSYPTRRNDVRQSPLRKIELAMNDELTGECLLSPPRILYDKYRWVAVAVQAFAGASERRSAVKGMN